MGRRRLDRPHLLGSGQCYVPRMRVDGSERLGGARAAKPGWGWWRWTVGIWRQLKSPTPRVERRLRLVIDSVVIAVLVTIAAISVGTAAVRRAERRAHDLLQGVEWRTSSTYSLFVAPGMFFHTDRDAQPSITYQFAAPTSLSSLTVRNSPAFPERAVPLVAELSDDGVTFTEVARIDNPFSIWRPAFARRATRYLRLRATSSTWLHLRSIEAHA